ncbi:MAG: radical SAM protein [Lachnospiraceae bacterium]|nr:radical SAM protein [Lachnospiraceae bacterium]
MAVKLNELTCKNILTKSKLPDADYVINPYVGCTHKCIYCYAEFMKRFTKHSEEWGCFLDVKNGYVKLKTGDLSDKTVLISSVTDAYNPFEKKYEKMREILSTLIESDIRIDILTKSSLVVRDIDLLSKLKHIKIGFSINTLDDDFRKKTEPGAGSIGERIVALKKLKECGIETYAFVGPIFPEISNIELIVESLYKYVDNFYFENLNLRGTYKQRVMDFIGIEFPHLINLYENIYNRKIMSYWVETEKNIEKIFGTRMNYKCYFYHDKIKKN